MLFIYTLQALSEARRRFRAIVVTSQRAATRLRAELQALLQAGFEGFNNVPIFVVGRKTEASLSDCGATIMGASAGSASALVPIIVDYLQSTASSANLPSAADTSSTSSDSASGLPVLFIRGENALDTIPKSLAEAGIPCEELTVYRSIPAAADELECSWRKCLSAGHCCADGGDDVSDNSSATAQRTDKISTLNQWQPSVLVFFSPSGFDTALSCSSIAAAVSSCRASSRSSIGDGTGAMDGAAPSELDRQHQHQDWNAGHEHRPSRDPTSLAAPFGGSPSSSIVLIAIGPTTAAAIEGRDYTCDGVAPTPDPPGLLAALADAASTRSADTRS